MSIPVLVVGGAGYIGSHTCKALARGGYQPVAFDNLSTGHEDFVRWGPLIRGDISDWAQLASIIERSSIKIVLHFAASALVGESMVDPQKYYENNVSGTLSLLRAMRLAECPQIVFSSTCAIYGEPQIVPISESTRPDPVNPYGASKLMIERVLADYSRAYGMKFIALRYFNAAGADPDAEIGELREVETHLIPRAMMAIQGYIQDFQVYGSDYPTEDGTAVRDFIHVADLAEAHVLAVNALTNGHQGGAFNLGTGRGHSVKQVLNEINRATGERLPVPYGQRRSGDPAVLVANGSLAEAELGFVPTRSDLKTIVDTAWQWHQRAHPRRNT